MSGDEDKIFNKNQLLKEKMNMENNTRKVSPITLLTLDKVLFPLKNKDKSKVGKVFLTFSSNYIWLFLFVVEGILFALYGFIVWAMVLFLNSTGMVYLGFLTIGGILLFTAPTLYFRGARIWQSTCFYCSVSAAKSLEESKFVEASLYVDKLLSVINYYTKATTKEIECFNVKVKVLFHDKIESLCDNKSAVVKAILESDALNRRFAYHLYNLANSLFSSNINVKEASFSLGFLVDNCQKYFNEDAFLLKHKTANASLKGLNTLLPIVVPLILTILGAILKIVFNYPP